MPYEFTKQKIADERKVLARRLVLSGSVAVAGLALGVATNDMHSLFGIFAASALATFPAVAAYYSMT